jgi:hypothetical protein
MAHTPALQGPASFHALLLASKHSTDRVVVVLLTIIQQPVAEGIEDKKPGKPG